MIQEIERKFRPALELLAQDLRNHRSSVQFSVYSGPVGSLTDFQGWHLGIEAIFPSQGTNLSDNVALEICVCDLTISHQMMVDIAWGHPAGTVADFLWDGNWTRLSAATLLELETQFPRLINSFKECISKVAKD